MTSTLAGAALETLLYEKKAGIAYVTLNRPKVLNALNQRTWEELRTVLEDARDDESVRGVIVTGGRQSVHRRRRYQRTRARNCG